MEYDEYWADSWGLPSRWAPEARRDVNSLTVGELAKRSADEPHRRRPPIVLEGVAVKETLKQRFTREVAEVEEAIVALSSKRAARMKQLKHLEMFPDEDPFVDGTTIFFEKAFPHTPDKKYEYAAVRTDGHWHVTGARSPQNVLWSDLVNWMGLGVDEIFTIKRTGKSFTKVIG